MQLAAQVVTTALIAILGSVVSATVDYWLRRGRPRPSRRLLSMIAIGVLLWTPVGILVTIWTAQEFNHPRPIAEIVFPADGQEAAECVDVRGTSTDIGPENKLWVAVIPPGGNDYYIQRPVASLGGNEWQSKACPGGDLGEYGVVVVITKNEGVNDGLVAYREMCERLEQAREICPPLSRLWQDLTVVDRISIERVAGTP